MPKNGFANLFGRIASQYLAEFSCNVPLNACPDQYVGNIDKHGYLPDKSPILNDFCIRRQPDQVPLDQGLVILILESPHKREFNAGRCPQPAAGKTGANIRTLIGTALVPLRLTGPKSLILMNVIQHQCSLGVAPKAHRDKVFRSMWERPEVEADFRKRLTTYISLGKQGNSIVVNACTAGKSNPKLRFLVERSIKTVNQRGSDLRVSHPSAWPLGSAGIKYWGGQNA